MKKFYLLMISLLLMALACKEKYVPTLQVPVTIGYLVVEGYINSGTGATSITLTHTVKVSAEGAPRPESNAIVRIENAGNNSTFLLTETGRGTGVYNNPQLNLIPGTAYRLYIKTQDNKIYTSEYSDYRVTPDIDSVSWRREKGGVQIYTTAHGTTDTGFYKVGYDETWEFVSPKASKLKLVRNAAGEAIDIVYFDPLFHTYNQEMYRCWKYDTSHGVLITSTEKLQSNLMYLFPTQFIEENDWRLDERYSMQVHLFSMSRKGFQFYQALQKNTESVGTVFDPQPSDNNGNMTCVTNPAEPVVGFIEITQEKTKRIFIVNAEVPNWHSSTNCFDPDSTYSISNSKKDLQSVRTELPTEPGMTYLNTIQDAYFGTALCVDCRLRGSTKRPPYW